MVGLIEYMHLGIRHTFVHLQSNVNSFVRDFPPHHLYRYDNILQLLLDMFAVDKNQILVGTRAYRDDFIVTFELCRSLIIFYRS